MVTEWGAANLDMNKEFITIIPESMVSDIDYIENQMVQNREYSIKHRQEIREYAESFAWEKVIEKYYVPAMEKIISK